MMCCYQRDSGMKNGGFFGEMRKSKLCRTRKNARTAVSRTTRRKAWSLMKNHHPSKC
ncbi:unnamed protein product [Tenebrio molitor]|nr:unnamed protein product [Tenebrio molitor]